MIKSYATTADVVKSKPDHPMAEYGTVFLAHSILKALSQNIVPIIVHENESCVVISSHCIQQYLLQNFVVRTHVYVAKKDIFGNSNLLMP